MRGGTILAQTSARVTPPKWAVTANHQRTNSACLPTQSSHLAVAADAGRGPRGTYLRTRSAGPVVCGARIQRAMTGPVRSVYCV